MLDKLVIATRRSKLAIWQSQYVKSLLQEIYPKLKIEIKEFVTKGDKILDVPLAKIGGKGLFTKELEEAILNGEAHIAVHSLKDVPTKFEKGLILAAVTKRFDPRDALLSNKYKSIEDLPKNCIIGTTSLRRRMELKILRPEIQFKELRGNINTRIEKLKANEYDGIILASTGIQKLQLENEVNFFTPIPTNIMIPSMGQATLAIESSTNQEILDIVQILNDKNAHIESTIERDFVDCLEGGCQVPIGIKATVLDEKLVKVQAILGLPDGTEYISDQITENINNFETIGTNLAKEFIKKGAKDLLLRAEKLAFK